MSATVVETAGVLCKRYGPGRLPGADNRSIGAGYAFATAALLASVAFVVPYAVIRLLEGGPSALLRSIEGGLPYFGLFAIPFVVPAAFVAGALTWRLLPETVPYYGPVSGLVATVLTYVGATALVAAVILVNSFLSPTTVFEPGTAFIVAGLFGGVGFAYTFWITLPAGALSGYVHERASGEN
jgi:hypothetical protein